jgi:hypothetical protein
VSISRNVKYPNPEGVSLAGSGQRRAIHWNTVHLVTLVVATWATLLLATLAIGGGSTQIMWVLLGGLWVSIFALAFSMLQSMSAKASPRTYERNVFIFSLVLRVVATIGIYFAFESWIGSSFEPFAADSLEYHERAVTMANQITSGGFSLQASVNQAGLSDTGYVFLVALVYALFGPSVIIVRLIHAVLGALSVVLIYRTMSRLADDKTARTTTNLFAVYPYLIYYTALHLKETVMLLLVIAAFLQCARITAREGSLVRDGTLLLTLIATLFAFRTVLALILIFAIVFHFLLQKTEGKRRRRLVMVALVAASVSAVFAATQRNIRQEILSVWLRRGDQWERELADKENKMGGRSAGGVFVSRAGSVASATLGPLPNVTAFAGQENGSIQLGFAWLRQALFIFAALGAWFVARTNFRKWSFLLLYTFAYTIVLAEAGLSTSHRFQLPAAIGWLMLVAIGLHTPYRKGRVYFAWTLSLCAMAAAVIYWNYFKLLVRGI